ncbi:MAG: surface lipoprotein assembly modifier [Neisseria sp.]|uniref:surface lipoprotein assembly modifier n=1 Tax=Neisseria sp. TaxID=192066 RepID=UPI0026DAA8DA|nr:surface lipoprotein assembly modifier [Neisseria sp.]MDO4641422.1 surface lipoprotein assembly modifier [Neisseria sp.]
MKRSALFLIFVSAIRCATAAEGEAALEHPVAENNGPYKPVEKAPPSDAELKNALETAITTKNWDNMADLLQQYRARFLADQVFADYAEAQWRSSKGEYMQAQALYRRVLAQRPDWQAARAAMINNLSAARSQPKAGDYSRKLQASDVWQLPVQISRESADDSAGRRTNSRLRNGIFTSKTNDAFRFNLGAERDFELTGNHKLRVGLTSRGMHYWDYYDRSTRSVRLAAGYRSAAGKQSWSLTPYTEQSWLGSEKYILNKGASASYSNKLTDTWRVSLSASSINRSYNNPDYAKYYNGTLSSLSGSAEWHPDDAWTFNLGTDYRADQTENRTRASDRAIIRTGISRKFENGLRAGASVQYGRRDFGHSETLYGFGRKDNEYNASASLSFQPRRWKGVSPKLDYRYSKVDSNVKSSSSKTSQWYMSLEKRF